MDTEEFLAAYRETRRFVADYQTAAMKSVLPAAIMEQAKRIGLVKDGKLQPGSPAEMTLVFDLAIHTAKDGRSRAIDRVAKQRALPEGGQEATVMEAVRTALFTVWRVDGPHETAGLMAFDVLRQTPFWMVDEWLATSVKPGDRFVTRLADMGDYRMSCGANVPVNDNVFQLVAADPRNARASGIDAILRDRRFAEAFYRAAVTGRVMRGIAFREPGQPDPRG